MVRFSSSSLSHLPSLLVLPLVLIFAFITTSHSVYTTISSGADLKAFAEEVNGGSGTYKGSTVTLESDIDLAGVDFTPIGNYIPGITGLDFRGVFEGNGHVIKNMNLASSSLIYMGLFGYSFGCTIKDVVIDSSCSVTNNFVDGTKFGYAGGVIGCTDTGTGVGEIRIQNCVNMGTIKGTGGYSVIGGIAGMHSASRFPSYIINCVNIGNIVYSGTASKAIVGGIVGWETMNYDGIFPSIINCVNLKTLTLTTQPNSVGAILGHSEENGSIIQNNYWLEGTASQGYTGIGTFSNNEAFDSDYKLSSTGSSLVDALNSYISSQPSSLGLRKAGTVSFNTNGGSSVSTRTSVLVMLWTPETPTKTEGHFEGWYMDSRFNEQWTSTTLFDGDGTLYAKWRMNQYTVFFNANGGSSLEHMVGDYSRTIPLPASTRTGYTFASWNDDKGNTFTYSYTISRAENVTITAQWTPNNYTVTFITNGGDSLNESERTKGVTYDQKYGDLPVPTRTGYSFNGWLTEGGGESVTSETIVTTPNDHTLTAQWIINNYTVTFDLGNGTIVEKRTFAFNETIEYPEHLTKEGYTFAGWNSNITEMPANNLIIKALWSIINYILTFEFGNGTVEERVLDFNETIVYPENLTMEGYIFNGWDINPAFMPAKDIVITAQWTINNYILTFEFGNGTVEERVLDFNETILYPENQTKTGYTFDGWDNNITEMPANNLIIKALWSIINYILTFDFGNGTVEERVLAFNETIDYPENIAKKVGYEFLGWNNTITMMPAEDTAIKALWNVSTSTFVEIVFGKKGMSEKEIRDFISDYTQGENYEIKIFDPENEGITVIVKFNDVEKAENFVETIKDFEEVERVGYTQGTLFSFSPNILSSLFFFFLITFCYN